MQAVVLVGGFGTRLRPLTLRTPKQMLPVGPIPMIELVAQHLASQGVSEIILALGYKQDVFCDAYPDNTIAGIDVRYAVEPEPLDTAGAIGFAARQAGIRSTFIAINGDVINDLDLRALVALHNEREGQGTIHLTPVDDPSRYGVVPIDANNKVEAFIEKPNRDEAPSRWINGGTYVFEPSVLDRIPEGAPTSIERKVFPDMVADGVLFAMESEGYWVDAGTPPTYLQVGLDLINGVRGSAEGVDSTAKVDASATLSRSIVGANCVIEAGAVVKDAMLHAGVTIQAGATVTDSIVGADATVGSDAKISDLCVIGPGENVEAGTVLNAAKVPES